MINNIGNSNKKVNENKENKDSKDNNYNSEDKENNKKIMESIQLLIGTLSLNGLKEVQSEVQQLLSNMKK